MPQRATAFGTTVSANWSEMGWREATGGRHAVDGDNGPALIAANILGCTYCLHGDKKGRGGEQISGYISHDVMTRLKKNL